MLNRSLLVMVLVATTCIVSLCFAISDGEIQIPPQNNLIINEPLSRQETNKTNRDDQFPPKQIPTTSQEKTYKNPSKSNIDQDNRWQKFWNFSLTDLLLAIFTCLLVAVGALQTCILKGTLKVTDGLLKVSQEQSRDMKASIAVAKDAADAAQKSAYAAIQTIGTLEAQERAYIFVTVRLDTANNDPDEIIRTGTDGLPGVNHAHIVVTNYGKTPADLMNIHRKVDCFDQSTDVSNHFANILAPSNPAIVPGTEIIISGEERIYTTQFFVYQTELQNVINSTSRLLCVGCIQYEDVFGKLHNTVFCWEYQGLIENFFPCKEYRFNYRT